MDGVAQANYALSYMANVGIQQQPWPAKQQEKDKNNVVAGPLEGVGAVGSEYPEIGINGRPVEPGAKVMRSVDGDTVTISAEGQAFVQQAAAAADTPDMTSATARVEEAEGRVQPVGAAQAERPEETRFDLPQGGGIERAEFEQPEVLQIQDEAEKTQAEERTALQLQSQEKETSAVEAAPEEEEEAAEEIEPSDFRQYFNSELRQMLYRGQITQEQYNNEMESRKSEDDLKIDKKVV